jgi:sodium/proline symporter
MIDSIWIIVGFSLPVCGFLFVAWWAQRQATGSRADYLLADRSFGTWVVGLSTAGAANSGFMFLGAVGAGYTLGVQALWWPIGFFIGDLVFWSLFPARVNALARERGVFTAPGLLAAQFSAQSGQRVRQVAGIVILVFTGIYLVS